MLKEYKTTNRTELNNSLTNIEINISDLTKNELINLKSKNNTFNFNFLVSENFKLPDGYYDKPYPTATVYNELTSGAPITPYQIEYNTNIYNYLNSYSVILENDDKVANLQAHTINTIYYGDIIEYNSHNHLLYGFSIDYKNSITTKDITTINGSGFSLNPNGNRYNTISFNIADYNPMFFYNHNSLNDYYYYNSTLEKQVLASPYINTDPNLGSYEINGNYAYFKDYINGDSTISFNPYPILYTNNNNYSYQRKFTKLNDYYVGNNINNFNYKYGFIAANTEDAVNTSNGTEYNYFYNYTNIIKDQQFTMYSDILEFQNNIKESNNNIYLNTTNNIELNNNNYIYNNEYPKFQALNLKNKLVSTDNIKLTLHTVDITELFSTSNTTIQANDVFTNMQNVQIGGVYLGALLSAVLTFTLIVSLLKLGK